MTLSRRLEEVGPQLMEHARRQLLSAPFTIIIKDDSQQRLGKICLARLDSVGAMNIEDVNADVLAKVEFPLLVFMEDSKERRLPHGTLRENQLVFI